MYPLGLGSPWSVVVTVFCLFVYFLCFNQSWLSVVACFLPREVSLMSVTKDTFLRLMCLFGGRGGHKHVCALVRTWGQSATLFPSHVSPPSLLLSTVSLASAAAPLKWASGRSPLPTSPWACWGYRCEPQHPATASCVLRGFRELNSGPQARTVSTLALWALSLTLQTVLKTFNFTNSQRNTDETKLHKIG